MPMCRPVASGPSKRETYVYIPPGIVADDEVYLSRDIIKEGLTQRDKSRSNWAGASHTWESPNPRCVFCNKSFDENHERTSRIPSCKHYSHRLCLEEKGSTGEKPCATCKMEADLIQQASINSGDGGIWDLLLKAYNHPISKLLNYANLAFSAHYFNLTGRIFRYLFNTAG
ncbi:hypothetical protein PTTG_01963 [Puccinia triticina 1-1 BBBD Race 1]|uniref:RING-type domain-containing protein n=2 Tax=Puccinia triticina TaxID=208348 RepID=A0A180G8D6_PUCT1|nr:uncharacterized protein PtA15_7A517 [Puccinia triticina]OAV88880.1 hypothetical protein PTTG_01963 [Puccinia triticina 1-1 BBBD Race 1]WAQ86788.1 hypothetical protein PtA15_7A517 [Puccinia triticina]